jgi:N-glycosidase YbiA
MAIYFYRVEDEYGEFSNFSRHSFSLEGHKWKTSEHYFQAQKFVGTPHYGEVMRASSPGEAARAGRDRKRPLRKDWESVKDGVMMKALRAKFAAYPELVTLLLSTNEEALIENTTNDYYWGCGTDGTGKNMLGRLLVKLREELKRETKSTGV